MCRLQRRVSPRQSAVRYPLTITDFASRFLLACAALSTTREQYAFAVFERSFKDYGLPARSGPTTACPSRRRRRSMGSAHASHLELPAPRLGGDRHPLRPDPDEHIWLVSFMHYDLGYFDDEACRLEPIDNPFGPRCYPCARNDLLPVQSEWTASALQGREHLLRPPTAPTRSIALEDFGVEYRVPD